MAQQKTPPQYVPTLTEVVQPVVLDTQHAASAFMPASPVAPPTGLSEEQLVHRILQRVDLLLERRLREAIATVVLEQTRSIAPALREEIEIVVRQTVSDALAQELTRS